MGASEEGSRRQRIGMRINNSSVVCAVHAGTSAANAGLHLGDLVVAVDNIQCTADVSWRDGLR